MKVNKRFKPELCASKDPTRLMMQHIHFDKDAKSLVATDGHRMCVVPVEDCDSDITGAVTAEVLKTARKAVPKTANDLEFEANGVLTLPNGATYPRPEGAFPSWRQVIPSKDTPCTISFNARLLKEIADAIGSDDGIVVLAISGPRDPILVYNTMMMGNREILAQRGDCDAFAVLMPAACKDCDDTGDAE